MNKKELWPGWEVVRAIGSGGFGKVYEIRKSEKSVTGDYRSALKMISIPQSPDEYSSYKDDGYDDKSITAIFRSQVNDIVSEFALMSQFKGTANIVSYEDHMIVEHVEDNGWDILIRMELLTSLPEYYRKREMTEKDIIQLGIDICHALELCASKNIIHRDIKPQNIFANDFGDFKLGDFGIAKTMDHTTRATKIGTYDYMAPEVYRGEPYNANVDIYSLGLVLFWLLNERKQPFLPLDKPPTAIQKSDAHMRRISGEAIPEPKNGSDELKAIIAKACSYEPEKRYTDATEMKQALMHINGSESKFAEEAMANTEDGRTVLLISEDEHTCNMCETEVMEADRTVLLKDECENGIDERTVAVNSVAAAENKNKAVERTVSVHPAVKNETAVLSQANNLVRNRGKNSESVTTKKKRSIIGISLLTVAGIAICISLFAFFASAICYDSKTGIFYTNFFRNEKLSGDYKYVWSNGNVYEGNFINGERTGFGKLKLGNGDIYEGDFVSGERTGKGKYIWGKDSELSGNVYEGDFVNGVRTGRGKLTFANGNIYEGDYLEGEMTGDGKFIWGNNSELCGNIYEGNFINGIRTGLGKLTFANGDLYYGDFISGERTGKGKYIWGKNSELSGNVYEGDFVNGVRTGLGKLTFANGDLYYGDFINGERTGSGKYTWGLESNLSGNVYEGDFVNGIRTGHGKLTFANGNVYEGDYQEGEMTGKGKYTWGPESKLSGNVYEGDFVNGIRTGHGKLTFANGNVYEGDYQEGEMTGKGKYTWGPESKLSGNVYEGDFVNGVRTGYGKLTFANGNIYEGDYVNGERTGYGKLTLSDGTVYEGEFINGVFQS